jgi:hypothetical protein
VQQQPRHATGAGSAVHLYPPTCTQAGGVKRALSTVYLLILSSGQAREDPPRNTAGGGLDHSRKLESDPNPDVVNLDPHYCLLSSHDLFNA